MVKIKLAEIHESLRFNSGKIYTFDRVLKKKTVDPYTTLTPRSRQ